MYSSELEQLKLEVRDLKAHNQLLSATNEAEVTELKTKVAVYKDQIENNDIIMQEQREEFKAEIKQSRVQVARLTDEKHQLEAESVVNTASLKHKISTLEAETSRKTATVKRKESELKAKTRVLEEKEAIISEMSEQLTRTREHLTAKQQVSSECE